jgi:hypothetical protein
MVPTIEELYMLDSGLGGIVADSAGKKRDAAKIGGARHGICSFTWQMCV